ncbi:hypothetical protein QE152_g7863 [Popillia japonica]|uniref:Adenylate kinase n=1 Tax=Popillia japonica TaxID=7064 RepID=A0AAW1M6D1_POPJA
MIVDIVKEEILKKVNEAKGFILNGFPRTSKQAVLFVKEVKDVDAIIYLYSETYKMVSRVQEKKGDIDEESVKNEIFKYVNEVKEGTAKFSAKVEKIYTDAAPEEVFNKIESSLNLRLKHYKRAVICRRSDDSFALKREFRTIAQCMDYARERTALAINYSPPDAAKLRKNIEDYLPNCQILGCPDIGYSNMINDSGYDYYSAYKNLSRK